MSEPDDPTRREPAPPIDVQPPVGVLAGRYRLLALVGTGGMGSVYLADDLELHERVALKMFRASDPRDAELVERLRAEVRLARRVTHKNVARTYDIGEHEGERFLTMQFVDGESLAYRVARDGPLAEPEFLTLAQDVTAGLVAAHAAGVVHRDLKPQNIVVTRDGHAIITDFGTAWSRDVEAADLVAGTPSYMAPEQFEGEFDERSDVFALGAVFHVMLTGDKPFSVDPDERPTRPPNPHDRRGAVSPALGVLVARCLAARPQERYPSAVAVAQALAAVAADATRDRAPISAVGRAAASVLRRVSSGPRSVLVQGAGAQREAALARGLRDEIAARLNEHASLVAIDDPARPHEASAHVEVVPALDAVVLGVRLVASREGFEFWRATFTGLPEHAVDLARAAARGIERALAVDVRRSAACPPLGKEATALYLAGRSDYQEFWPDALRRGARSLEAALVHAPAHPLVLSALAATRARLCFFSEGSIDEARAAAELAVSLAPDMAEPHIARATLHSQDAEPELAVAALLHAFLLAPGHADALAALGRILLEVGAPIDSLRMSEASHARDRGDTTLVTIARALALLGRWDDALRALDRMRGPARDNIGLAMRARASMWRREPRGVAAALERVRALGATRDEPSYHLMFVVAEAVLEGKSPHTAAGAPARGLGAPSRTRLAFVNQVNAEADAYLGDLESALASIERSTADGLYDAFWLERCPLFDELRGASRFEAAREVVQGRARRVLALFHAGQAEA